MLSAYVEGYRHVPPAQPDAWGPVTAPGVSAERELLSRLDEEEERGGHSPW